MGLAFAELTLVAMSQFYLSRRDHPLVTYEAGEEPLRVLCIGESTTAGMMAGPGGTYPLQLERILSASESGRQFKVINEGRPAVDTTYLVDHIEELLEKHRPHLVVAMMGVNDGRLHAREFQVGGGPRIWKLARLVWMTLVGEPTSEVEQDTWAVGLRVMAEQGRAGDTAQLDAIGVTRALEMFEQTARDEPAIALDWARRAVEQAPDSPYVRARLLLPWPSLAVDGAVEHRSQPDSTGVAWKDQGFEDPLLGVLDGMLAIRVGANQGALDVFRRSLASPELSAMAVESYVYMVHQLAELGLSELALKALEAALAAPQPSDRALGLCARLRSAAGDDREAERCLTKARALRGDLHNRKTHRNYQRLLDLLSARGIPLIAMQYPSRSITPLRKMLGDPPGVFFVSNEEAFREAATEEGRAKLFADLFAGDFGHLTKEGNRRVAENLADTIVREVLPRAFGTSTKDKPTRTPPDRRPLVTGSEQKNDGR